MSEGVALFLKKFRLKRSASHPMSRLRRAGAMGASPSSSMSLTGL